MIISLNQQFVKCMPNVKPVNSPMSFGMLESHTLKGQLWSYQVKSVVQQELQACPKAKIMRRYQAVVAPLLTRFRLPDSHF